MDIDDYYFRTKNSKQRKYEGSSRRKGHTIRSTGRGNKGKKSVEVVAKTIRTTKDWDEKRINEYCENVLEDGGIPPQSVDYLGKGLSMKKQKRWALSSKIRDAMYEEIDDEQAPSVLLVERALAPSCWFARGGRANVTRATYVTAKPMNDTNGTHEAREHSPPRRIVDKTPNGKHGYSYAEDLTGCPVMRHRRRTLDENKRPEITYDFCYASPPDRNPGDLVSEKPYTYRYETKRASYVDQIDEYYSAKRQGIDWAQDDYDKDCHHPQDGDEEVAETERSKEVSMDSLIQIGKSEATKKKKRRTSRLTSTSDKEDSIGKGMKGKVVILEGSENPFPSHEEIQENNTPAIKFSLKIRRSVVAEIKEAHREQVGKNLVEIANLRPVAFTADLRPHPLNEIQNESCHLVFQTDFDPDAYESFAEDIDECAVNITLFCRNEECSKLLRSHLTESLENVRCIIKDTSDLEVFILSAKQVVESIWPERKELPLQESQTQTRENAADSVTPQEFRRERVSLAVKGISEQVGLDPEYSTTEKLLTDFAATANDYEYEMVADPSAGEKCTKCNKQFQQQDRKGLALAACRHWFCEWCWRKHLIKSDQYLPKCIKMGCDARANLAAKLVFCSLSGRHEVRRFRGQVGDKIAHKCPSSSCNQVTKVNDSLKPLVLWCPCKRAWCGDCGADPHWPASCKAARRYRIELNLLKRKVLFENVKICPRCGEVTLSEAPKGLHWHRPEFDFRNNCWKGAKEHSPFYNYTRLPHWTHCWWSVDETPSQSLFFVDGFPLDKETAVANHEVFGKYHDALWNNEIDSKARSRANSFLKEDGKQDLMPVVDDLILVKNQVCYVLLFTHVALRYDHSGKSSHSAKYLVGMSKKMEILVERINYFLMKRDYKSRDSLFPTTYQTLAVKGKRLVKDLFQVIARGK